MAWWQILVGIILFIVALGVLIGIHELGHLSAAKMFHVYCFNYSIGFGPKLISSKRTKKHETIWTLRAIPLGGFVSMYGEGAELDSDEYIPPSRSLEGIARYKRAVIISAGVFLNFILGFVLIVIHNGCFPHYYFVFPNQEVAAETSTVTIRQQSMDCSFKDEMLSYDLKDGDSLKVLLDPFAGVFLIDTDVTISDLNEYVVCMSNNVTTTKTDPSVTDSLIIYSKKDLNTFADEAVKAGFSDTRLVSFVLANDISKKEEDVKSEIASLTKDQKDVRYKSEVINYYEYRGYHSVPDTSKQYNIDKNTPDISVDLRFYKQGTHEVVDKTVTFKKNQGSSFINPGIYLRRYSERYDFQKTFRVSWEEWCGANTAVFRGLGMLFTGQGEVSGPIGIAKMSTSILANFGFERYLYLWGMISCNLAILNLLPFPGLDGWALVVIGYEAIRKKQIPTKVKSIISVIGLGLLFLLMIFIIIKDVIGLII